jgi:Nucleotide modification associated domain 2
MPKLFVYRIVNDIGVAPHISKNGILTLTLCKPGIRKSAKVGDYVLALVALQHTKITGTNPDRFFKAAYLFKVTDITNILEYEAWCQIHAPDKICTENAFEGNCQYDKEGKWRYGPHNESHKERNLGGKFALISKHYTAWTSAKPYTLTPEIMEHIGLDENQIKTATRNYFTVSLVSDVQIQALEELININKPKNIIKCTGKACKMGGKRNTRKQK